MRMIYVALLFFGIKILSLPPSYEWRDWAGALYILTFCYMLDWDIKRQKI